MVTDEQFERKLWNVVNANKPKTITRDGKKYYISRPMIEEIKHKHKKEGGIFPLIPLILGGIAAAGSVAGGAAGIAKAVQDKKASDAQLNQQRHHDA